MEPLDVAASSQGNPLVMIIGLIIALFMIIAMWKVFTKAGQPGWGCIIPIYNAYLMIKIACKPGWWLLLFFIPVVNLVVSTGVPAQSCPNVFLYRLMEYYTELRRICNG